NSIISSYDFVALIIVRLLQHSAESGGAACGREIWFECARKLGQFLPVQNQQLLCNQRLQASVQNILRMGGRSFPDSSAIPTTIAPALVGEPMIDRHFAGRNRS